MGGAPYKLAKEGSGCSFKCFCISYMMQDFWKKVQCELFFLIVCMNTWVSAISPTPISPTPISPTYYRSVPFRLLMQNVTKTM